jgi:hypothetical protein
MTKLHPLIIRVRKAQRRLTSEQVVALPYPALVRYCDALLTPEAAVHILAGCVDPEHSGAGKAPHRRGQEVA